MNDPRTDESAFADLVDRLLESPQYGEQWARHWLDVVRYADSSGFANDYERPNTWRYRDYVIRAFNEDKPFDDFASEQIAGDELDRDNVGELDRDRISAHGTLGTYRHERRQGHTTTMAWTTSPTRWAKSFSAQALQCCRCHDHKFDPIPDPRLLLHASRFRDDTVRGSRYRLAGFRKPSGMDEDRHYHELRHKLNNQRLGELGQKETAVRSRSG